jgi:hypothetical protein
MYTHNDFINDIAKATDEIDQKNSVSTNRVGNKSIRDNFAFYKMAIFFAYGYISIIQTMIIFLGVTPQAIVNLNLFFSTLHIPIQLPVNISSVLAIILIIILFFGGILAMKFIGLYKRELELSTLQSPGMYLVAKQNDEILKRLERLENEKGN